MAALDVFTIENDSPRVILNPSQAGVVDTYLSVAETLETALSSHQTAVDYTDNFAPVVIESLKTDVEAICSGLVAEVSNDSELVALLQGISNLYGVASWYGPNTAQVAKIGINYLENEIDDLDDHQSLLIRQKKAATPESQKKVAKFLSLKKDTRPKSHKEDAKLKSQIDQIAFTELVMKHILIRLRANKLFVESEVANAAAAGRETEALRLCVEVLDKKKGSASLWALCQLMQICDDLNLISEDIEAAIKTRMNYPSVYATWTGILTDFEAFYKQECWYVPGGARAQSDAGNRAN